MAFFLSPLGALPQFFTNQGAVLAGGKVYFFAAGTVTPQDTFTDSTGAVPNSHPIVLDSSGRPPTGIYLTEGLSYKVRLFDSAGNLVDDQDAVVGIQTAVQTSEWQSSGLTATYINATQFSFPGDQTTDAHIGRRLKVIDAGGTKYGTLTASAFGTLTTVTVELDGGASLANPLSAVSYGVLTVTNRSVPVLTDAVALLSGSVDRTKRIRFEVDGLTTSKTRVLTVPNQDFTIGPFARGVISGYTYANNGADSIDIAAGGAADSTNAYWLTGSALTKNITVAWALGSAQGMLDTGAVGNSDYYLWVIARSDTGVVDYLGSLSSTAPTMPANYDFKRLIGWFKRVGGTNVAFHTYETEGGGLQMNWDAPTLDVNLANTLTTARRTDAVKVPLNFSVSANLTVMITDATPGVISIIYCPDETDVAPSISAAPGANMSTQVAGVYDVKNMVVRTSATGTIAARSDTATVDAYRVITRGFSWARRN